MKLCKLLIVLSISAFFVAIPSFAQQTTLTCKDIKNGAFYIYPKNSASQYLDERDGDLLKETDLVTGDTALWKVKWNNDCEYKLTYISGSTKWNDEQKKFLKKHDLAFKIITVTNDYYTYTGHVDISSNPVINADTMWYHEKVNFTSNELFKQTTTAALKKQPFSDTADYALLYVYRPGKVTLSLSNFLIYFDDNLLCVGDNNTGYVFKILKEGNYKIMSRFAKDKAATDISIKFGHSYYVRSVMQWTIHKFTNYKLKMELVKEDIGKLEFEDLKHKE